MIYRVSGLLFCSTGLDITMSCSSLERGNDMELKSCFHIITGIKKETKAVFFRDLRVGHWIIVSMKLKDPGYGHSRYATTVKITNAVSGAEYINSQTIIANRLKNFEYEASCDQ